MKEPPFRTVPTFAPCNQHVYFLADQGEKLFQVWKPGLNFSLLGLALGTGFEPLIVTTDFQARLTLAYNF